MSEQNIDSKICVVFFLLVQSTTAVQHVSTKVLLCSDKRNSHSFKVIQ